MTAHRPTNSRRSIRATLSSIADVLSGAGACASAVESGRTPNRHALKSVGIDAESWSRIGQR